MSKKVGIALLYLSGPLFLMLTDPSRLPIPLLVVPFLWLFMVLFMTTYWLLVTRQGGIPRRRAAIAAGIVATLPVLLFVFQSIHQLSLKDVLLSVGLVAVATFYLRRADFIN